MSNNNSEKSIESLSLDKMVTSKIIQNKPGGSSKNLNFKFETKESQSLSNHNSDEEELIRNKLILTTNDKDLSSKQKLYSNEINIKKNGGLSLCLSPIKKEVKKRKLLVDIMEKSKKEIGPKTPLIYTQALNLNKEENLKNERKDVYGVPINRRNRKKIKVTFSDTIDNNNTKQGKNQLVEVIPISSYKKYNYVEGFPREEDIANDKSTCKCCLIN